MVVDLFEASDLVDREPPDDDGFDGEAGPAGDDRWDAAYLELVEQVRVEGVEVASHPLGHWGYEDLVEVVAESERASRAAIARGMAATAELARRLPSGGQIRDWNARAAGVSEFAPTQLAMAMGVSQRSADIRLHEAWALDHRLPRTFAALSVGLLGMPGVRVLISETLLLDDAGAAQAESRVLDKLGATMLPGLGRLSPGQIAALPVRDVERVAGSATSSAVRRLARRAVTQLDADAVRKRTVAARASRGLQYSPYGCGEGMAWVGSALPQEQALAGYLRVCDIADAVTDPDDPRSIEEVRADVFADLLLGVPLPTPTGDDTPNKADEDASEDDGANVGTGRMAWAGPTGPAGTCGAGAVVNVTVLIDADGVAEVDRTGPISPTTFDALLALSKRSGGQVHTITQNPVTCPAGHPPGDTTDAHDPSAAMRRSVQLRDVTCRFPGCTVLATRCDLDHTVPWPHGPTCPCNLAALCRHHHRLKTHDPDWTLTNHNNGHPTWTTPWGTNHKVTP